MSYALLIDDDEGVRESVSRAAALAGFELLTATSWDEGLALFQVHSPLLVIADYNLPDSRHGLQLLAEIRRITPAVRLVLLSAYIDDQDVHDIEALGLVDRAIPKLQAGATEDLLSELEDARRRAETTTDWPAYARAHREARRVEQPDIDALDARIRKARGIN